MDHFLIPQGATHVRVRYIGNETYDGGSFHDYPERTQWQEEVRLGKSDFDSASLDTSNVEAFFQRWLYFGMLVGIFNIGGVSVDQQDFLETDGDQRYLTTKRLNNYIARWELLWAGPANSIGHHGSWAKTKAVLDEVNARIDSLGGVHCPTFHNESYARNERGLSSAVSGETLTAIVALAYTLSEVAIKLYQPTWNRFDKYVNYSTSLLVDRLRANGWCRSDIRRMLTQLGTDGHYYFALLKSSHEEERHKGCFELVCVAANNVDKATYRTRHIQTCHGCDDMSDEEISATTRKAVEIIRDGGVPVVSWIGDDSGTKRTLLVEDAVCGRLDYVAISHVWADGLGNPYRNSLPNCQLDTIQRWVDGLPGGDIAGKRWFWMDTICVPVEEQHKRWRQAAIAKMADIYKGSTCVLTLDAWVRAISVNSSIADKIARLYVSNWVHRLWTTQESVLGDRLYVQFSDGQQLMDDIREPCQLYGKGMEKPKPWTSYTRFPDQMEEACFSYIRALQGYVKQEYASGGAAGGSLRLAHMSRALEQRATSRQEDETICASTLLSLDTAAFLAIEGPGVAERRMHEFWKQMKGMSKGIVFHHSPRCKQRGLRWAPRTLMGGRSGDFWRDFDKGISSFQGYGFTTNYPGIFIEGEVGPPSDGTLAVRLRGDTSMYYSVLLRPEEDGYPEWVEPARCALAMFRPVSLGGGRTDAILGIVDYGGPGSTISMVFQTRAEVEALPWTGKEDIPLFATRMADGQAWFVA
ncbi:hypothetical protein CC80DRAFT_537296 [Byssothecium circinans]|uniref:Heterokaryon incompatibility domain-containing protein n=1 Tax=Byssothecium circinans TaxID=147558 RepID=A0A6A5TP24_9PLEO|nr:hypothetical protein CC80DRAFT_537296 [Byssothecium circinans]